MHLGNVDDFRFVRVGGLGFRAAGIECQERECRRQCQDCLWGKVFLKVGEGHRRLGCAIFLYSII